MALLEVKNVSKIFKVRVRGKRTDFAAVDGVSLTVEKGTCVGLVGERLRQDDVGAHDPRYPPADPR